MVEPKAGDEVIIDDVTWVYLEQTKSWRKYEGLGLTDFTASGTKLTDIVTEWNRLHPEPPKRVKKEVKTLIARANATTGPNQLGPMPKPMAPPPPPGPIRPIIKLTAPPLPPPPAPPKPASNLEDHLRTHKNLPSSPPPLPPQSTTAYTIKPTKTEVDGHKTFNIYADGKFYKSCYVQDGEARKTTNKVVQLLDTSALAILLDADKKHKESVAKSQKEKKKAEPETKPEQEPQEAFTELEETVELAPLRSELLVFTIKGYEIKSAEKGKERVILYTDKGPLLAKTTSGGHFNDAYTDQPFLATNADKIYPEIFNELFQIYAVNKPTKLWSKLATRSGLAGVATWLGLYVGDFYDVVDKTMLNVDWIKNSGFGQFMYDAAENMPYKIEAAITVAAFTALGTALAYYIKSRRIGQPPNQIDSKLRDLEAKVAELQAQQTAKPLPAPAKSQEAKDLDIYNLEFEEVDVYNLEFEEVASKK